MMETKPYEQRDFSGGFTDNIYSNDPRKCAKNDNLLVDNNQKAFLRWGSDVYDFDDPQVPDGAVRVARLFKFADESWFFANHAREIYYFTTIWNYVTGPTGNPAFGAGDDTTHISVAEWQQHFFAVDDAGGKPIKLYQDQNGAWQVRTAGLPALALSDNFVTTTTTTALVALANELRTLMLRHFANTGYTYAPHKVVDAVSTALIGSACSDLTTCLALTGQLLKAYDYHYKDTLQGLTYHEKDTGQPTGLGGAPVGGLQTATMVLSSAVTPTDIVECAARLNDLHDKYYHHDLHIVPHAHDKANVSVGANPPTLTRVENINRGPVANRSWQPLYDWSVQWKATYNIHDADGTGAATAHSTAKDTVTPITVAVGTTIATMHMFLSWARTSYWAHEYDAAAVAPAYHAATEAGSHQLSEDLDYTTYTGSGRAPPLDPFGGAAQDYEDTVRKIAELATQYNAHIEDMTAHFTTNPQYVVNRGPGEDFAVASYNYAMHYAYTYTVGDVTYEDAGPVYFFSADTCLPVEQVAISLTGIPTLANDTSTNYDTTVITVKIYRTENAGNIYYLVGSVTNGTATFSDTMTDVILTSQPRLYTTGGVVENDPPPICKCLHIVEGKGYYGNIIEDGESLPNRVRQSIAGDPDSAPGSFFDDMDDEVMGISSVQTIPMALCKTSIYRIEGSFDELGRGSMRHVAIKNPGSVGLASEASIVRIDNGVLFAGTDGFYFTDAQILQKLSGDWNATYSGLVNTQAKAQRIQGTYDPISKRVFWCVQRENDEDHEENDSILCLDLNYSLESPCWTTWSNDGGHLSPTAILTWAGKLLRGHSLGYLFIHDASLLTDPYVNADVEVKSWGTKSVIVDYISIATDINSGAVRKWSGQVQAQFKDTDLFMAISTINEEGESRDLAPMRRRSTVAWNDLTINWGDPTILWNFQGNITRKRRMPAKSLRWTSKQMRFTSDYVLLKESGTVPGTATVVADEESVTLDDATYTWLPDCEGYFICFDDDDYDTQFEIDERYSDTVIYVKDPDGNLTDGVKAWKIYGQPKNQLVHFLSYAVIAAPLSISQADYRYEAADS